MMLVQAIVFRSRERDVSTIRGYKAAVLSTLQHTSDPHNVFFHFVTSADATLLGSSIAASTIASLISTSIRSALDCPLNYARSYLADLLPPCVCRVVYLDSDLVLVEDIAKLYAIQPGRARVLAAPEYGNANFTSYFTPTLWSNPTLITEGGEGGGV